MNYKAMMGTVENLLEEGMDYVKEDKSIKSFYMAKRRLKKELIEFAEENNCSFFSFKYEYEITLPNDNLFNLFTCDSEVNTLLIKWNYYSSPPTEFKIEFPPAVYSYKKKVKKYWRRSSKDGSIEWLIEPVYTKKLRRLSGYVFSKPPYYRKFLFLLMWLIKPCTEETINQLKETVEKMKKDIAVDKKISSINDNVMDKSLELLSKKYNVKYTMDKYNTFCMLTFRLRPYYKLNVKINYATLAEQLGELDEVLSKSLEISSSSIMPSISVNKSYSSLSI